MARMLHQIQGMYRAGDVATAIDVIRVLPEFDHLLFVNHGDGFDDAVASEARAAGAEIRANELVSPADIAPDVRAVLYHCVGNDDARRGEYIRLTDLRPDLIVGAWVHTPGLCGTSVERYDYFRAKALTHIIFSSTFSAQHTPGVDLRNGATPMVVHPAVDAGRYAGQVRRPDDVFRIGRWNRGDDRKYSDDFLELAGDIAERGAEVACMGIPDKFRTSRLPRNVRFYRNDEIPLAAFMASVDVLLFKTDEQSWHEGWCRTVTEAMAAGIVPVVENRGGIQDQVLHGYNGFLCDSNEEFVQSIELLRRDPAIRRRMADNGRSYAAKRLHLGSLRQAIWAMFESSEPARLNLTSGGSVRPGHVNAAALPFVGVDVVAPIDPWAPKLPFADGDFHEVVAHHVLEHVGDRNGILEELWRVARHNARISIRLPDGRHRDAVLDPTHRSVWDVDTVDFYVPGSSRAPTSPARFAVLDKATTGREIRWELLAIHGGPWWTMAEEAA